MKKKEIYILTKWIAYEFYPYTETLAFFGSVVVDKSRVLGGNKFAPGSV